jgi:hypothetical protein
MNRPFASSRPVGPFIFTSSSSEIESLMRRIERAGAQNPSHSYISQADVNVIDFLMAGEKLESLFKSSMELDNELNLERAQLRLATFKDEPSRKRLEPDVYENALESNNLDTWEEINNDIAEAIDGVIGIDYQNGIVQDDGIEIRTQDGYDMTTITPHIDIQPTIRGDTPMSTDELIEVISDINDFWTRKYFSLEVVSRT